MISFIRMINTNRRKLAKDLCIFLVIGIAIAFLLDWYGEKTDLGERMVNYVTACLTKAENLMADSGLWPSAKRVRNNGRVVYVDIDNKTYEEWGKPLLTPRDKLAIFLDYANRYGAKVVVLDVLSDYPDCCDREKDVRLRDALNRIKNNDLGPKVIIPVTVSPSAGKSDLGEIRESIFGDLVDNKKIFRGIPLGAASGYDHIYRYWITYQVAMQYKKPVVLWGVPLLAAVISDDKYHYLSEYEEKILGQITENATAPHSAEEIDMPSSSITFRDGNKSVVTFDLEDIYAQRIRYFVLPGSSLRIERHARVLKEPSEKSEKEIFGNFFKDKIVVIGNTSEELDDIHQTPVGRLPGMYIIGNAVATISEGLQPRALSKFIIWSIEIFTIILVFFVERWIKFSKESKRSSSKSDQNANAATSRQRLKKDMKEVIKSGVHKDIVGTKSISKWALQDIGHVLLILFLIVICLWLYIWKSIVLNILAPLLAHAFHERVTEKLDLIYKAILKKD